MAGTLTEAPQETRLPEHYEVVNGQIKEIPPMGAFASLIATILSRHLGTWADARGAGQVTCEVLFQLDAVGRLQRKPDVAFVSADRWPLNREVPETAAWKVVPNLAIEVVSPTNTAAEIADKIADYFRHGVEQVWIVLPRQKMVQIYDSSVSMHAVTEGDTLRGEPILPGFELPLANLFPQYTESAPPADV